MEDVDNGRDYACVGQAVDGKSLFSAQCCYKHEILKKKKKVQSSSYISSYYLFQDAYYLTC